MGGLSRRNTVLAELREAGPVVVLEAGNSLAPSAMARLPLEHEQRMVKAALIVDAWTLAGVDAVALGAHDWQLGTAEVLRLTEGLPVVAANLTCSSGAPFPASLVVRRGGRTFGVIGVTDGEVDGCSVGDPAAAVREAAAALPEVDVRVLLAPLEAPALVAVAREGLVDLVFDGASGRTRQIPEAAGSSWIVSAGSRTKMLGVLGVELVPGATSFQVVGALARVQQDVERLRQRLDTARQKQATEPSPEVAARYAAQVTHFERQLREAEARLESLESPGVISNGLLPADRALSKDIVDHPETAAKVAAALAALGPVAAPLSPETARVVAGGPYLGADGCRGCHAAQYAQWGATGHATALASLTASKRTFDLECWSCHVTGAGEAGGPLSPEAVGAFADVQCEACHGPAREHAKDPSKVPPPTARPTATSCVGCHDGARDEGRFDPATYLPKVAH